MLVEEVYLMIKYSAKTYPWIYKTSARQELRSFVLSGETNKILALTEWSGLLVRTVSNI